MPLSLFTIGLRVQSSSSHLIITMSFLKELSK